ncbi:ATP-dependent nuclease [Corynebacterium durum]|uniref:ATP-dependent nuclease n=1 Tax=Corynebacterium durum TaxID=61592 RepID=UPI0015C9A5F0|nr:AAA family ATPase [Corynebacterium durum]NYI72941.1 putative ATP-dependent endonuclease of OLD family [Corynebacterium durum]WJY84666.1 recombination protein F [Corynebacterium durum]
MYIKRIKMHNIRGLRGTTTVDLSPGLNYLVGENNVGKSTILFAIEYLRNGTNNNEQIYTTNSNESQVIVDLSGDDLEEMLGNEDFNKLQDFLWCDQQSKDLSKSKILRVRRQSNQETVQQGKKKVNIDAKKITFWNPKSSQFEAITGIDTKFKSLLDLNFIYADDAPEAHVNMGTSKTLGKLISAAISDIDKCKPWLNFTEAHKALFTQQGEGTVQNALQELSTEISEVITEQYGKATARFNFEVPDPTSLLKSGQVLLSSNINNEGETPLENKGTGLQRAFMLALLQVFGQKSQKRGSSGYQKMIFGLDEPETWLHPRAQLSLAKAIRGIADNQQVLLITHSPYMIQGFEENDSYTMLVMKNESGTPKIKTHDELNTCQLPYVSWNAINYYAFMIPSIEFMDELYGHFQNLCLQKDSAREKDIVTKLEELGISSSLQWYNNRDNKYYNVPNVVYVRNSVHHPENTKNPRYNNQQLIIAIEELEQAIHTWIEKNSR